MFYDMHTHSDFSPDGRVPLDKMCEAALALGHKAIAVTDHLDIFSTLPLGLMAFHAGGPGTMHRIIHSYDAEEIRKTVTAAREKYDGRLIVLYGVELGQPHHNPHPAEQFVGVHDFDVVVASLHTRYDGEDYFSAAYKPESLDFTVKSYFSSMLEMVRWGSFDILAHMDYILRYIIKAGLTADLFDYRERIRAILELLVKKDIALEINTSGARYPTGVGPAPWVLKDYRDIGGRLITIGTDSHRIEHMTMGVETAFEMARAAGFGEAAYYAGRRPYFYKF